jgi:hypothetical protein
MNLTKRLTDLAERIEAQIAGRVREIERIAEANRRLDRLRLQRSGAGSA